MLKKIIYRLIISIIVITLLGIYDLSKPKDITIINNRQALDNKKIEEILSQGIVIKLNNEYIYLLLKALFTGIVCKIVCDICSDTGNKALSTCVELAGQVVIMLLAIPLITALTGFAKGLLK